VPHRRLGVGSDRPRGELELGGEPDQLLLEPVVQRPLDRTALGVGGEEQPRARCTQLRDLQP
jgi:hypothetical protein